MPESFWRSFFLVDNPTAASLWAPLIGPVVAVVSFVCSIGNVPLATVLWNGGISFGGVIAFIFADLIVLPILNIYRKYYGWKSAYLLVTFYATMVGAGLVIEFLFDALGLIPGVRRARVVEAHVTFNYTTVLNLLFLILSAVFVVRFFRTGGMKMLRMMEAVPDQHAADEAGAVYTCPMHPEVRSEQPGRCPKCGMKLVPARPGVEHQRGHT